LTAANRVCRGIDIFGGVKMKPELLLLSLIAISFVATLVRSTFGFGESLVAVPLFVLVMPLEIAVPLSVLMSVFVALVVVVQDHRKIHFRSAKWLVLSSIPGIPIGLMILVYGNGYWVKIALGLLIMGYALYGLRAKGAGIAHADSGWWLFGCGFLSGVLGGAYGINGPPLVVYGNRRQWSAGHFRATLQAYFLPASAIGIAGYAVKGLLGWVVFQDFLWCLPAIVPAIFLGRYFNSRLKGMSFYRYVNWGLVVIGGLLIAFTLQGVG
jgi:uncharacterized protein